MADFSKGWIKILRSIQDHSLWKDKPFTKGQAWIDLILSANHKDNKSLKGNTIIEIKRGQILTSQLQLSNRWEWSRCKTRAFLSTLEAQEMICLKTNIQKDKGYSLITILNYNGIQENVKQEKTTKKTTDRQLIDNNSYTNNNVRMIKNEKEVLDISKDISVTNLIFNHFCKTYKETFSKDYIANFGKDKALIKKLLKIIPQEELLTLINRFFESEDKFITGSAYDIGIFYSQINKLRINKEGKFDKLFGR